MSRQAKIIMDDGTETTTGVGELCIRSPSLFKEYWRKSEVYIFLFMTDYVMYIFGRIPFHIFVQCPTPMIYNDKLYNFLYKYNTVYLYVLPLTFLLNCIPQTYSVCKIWSTLTIREPVTKI
jgi:acyl-CoA synthetase (AMP-forming)/AMP-acid ligase II